MTRYKGKSAFRSWLFSIAHNVLVDYYRRKRRDVPASDGAEALAYRDAPLGPEEQVLQRELFGRVGAALRRLPFGQQEALVLKFSGGLRNQEIAQVLGKSEGAVKMLIFRGVETLRRECSEV